jgi:transcriptional regulator with GAF, ATPase, and Fis domain
MAFMEPFVREGEHGVQIDDPARSENRTGDYPSINLAGKVEALHGRATLLKDLAIKLLSEIESLVTEEPGVAAAPGCLHDEVERFEVELITKALEGAGWNQAAAARRLGLRPTTLFYKIKRHGIDVTKPPRPFASNHDRH